MISDIYIDPEVFEWPCFSQSGTYKDKSSAHRSYELLEHAKHLIAGDTSELKTADAISNLKRAINVRLKLLEEYYRFSDSFATTKIGALERLELVGLAQHFMIKQLFELRNDIEHNDLAPPPISRVRELTEVTWYFLKATDSAVELVGIDLMFEAPAEASTDEAEIWLEARLISVSEHRIAIRGVLAPPFISSERGWKVEVQKLEAPERYTFVNTRYIAGEIVAEPNSVHIYWRRLFSAN